MRVANRLVAFLVGLALALAAGVALVEIVAATSGRPSLIIPRGTWDGVLRGLRWDDPRVVAVCAGMVAVGLALLVFELVPRRPLQLSLRQQSAGRSASIDRRGLQERLRRVAVQDPDVLGARVSVRRTAHVRALVPVDANPRETRGRLADAVSAAIDELQLWKGLRVKVDVTAAKDRVR